MLFTIPMGIAVGVGLCWDAWVFGALIGGFTSFILTGYMADKTKIRERRWK